MSETTSGFTLPGLLSRRAAHHPDWAALTTSDGTELSYAEWESRSDAVARGLHALGVGHGDRVALHFSHLAWIDYAIAYLAVHKCGAAALHLNDGLADGEVARRLRQCAAVGMLHAVDAVPGDLPVGWSRTVARAATEADTKTTTEAATGAGAATGPRAADDAAAGGAPRPASPEDVSDILYTSGTTGLPKAIAVPHRNTTHGRGPEGFAQFREPKPLVVPMTLGTNASATTLHIALASPTRLVLCPVGDVERFAQLAEEYRANSLMINPQLATRIVRERVAERYDLSAVETLANAAAPLSPAMARELLAAFPGAEITTTFTAAEAVPAAIVGTYDLERPFSLGVPARGTELRLTDESGADVADGELGEIRLRCAAPQRRYLDNEAANARVYQDGWVRTGDLACRLPDGRVELFDRASEAVRTRAGLVSTVHVEAAVYAHPAVRDASAVSVDVPDEAGASGEPDASGASGEQVVGVGVVLSEGCDLAALRSHLAEQLPERHIPAILREFSALPRSQNGKVIKHTLRTELAAAHRTAQEGTPMQIRATSSFSVDSWDEEPLQEWEGTVLTRTRMTKTFTGELEGTSEVLATMLKTPVENSMSYVAYERITGSIGERKGSFVVRHCTSMTPDSRSGTWTVIADTGTGDFAGVTGEGDIVAADGGQAFQLDLEFPPAG